MTNRALLGLDHLLRYGHWPTWQKARPRAATGSAWCDRFNCPGLDPTGGRAAFKVVMGLFVLGAIVTLTVIGALAL